MKRRAIIITAIVWMLVVVAIASSEITMMLLSDGSSATAYLVSEEDYETLQRYSRLEEVRSTLMEEYYIELDEDELVLGAIRGMMDSIGDPYTFYYTTEEMEEETEQTTGVYHGVGIAVQITEDGGIEVTNVYDDSPADEGGMEIGDRIIAVDGTSVSGESSETLSEAVSLIQGEDGTEVTLTITRGDETLDITLTRSEVSISYVEYSLIGDTIGYVSISQFSGDDVEGFEEALEFFKSSNVEGIIIDLRGNPGGLLTDVVAIADMVLPEGTITYIEDRDGNRQYETSTEDYWDIPLVVLVNGSSASASELFAAAIQDYDRGTIVGVTTYGKGIVQTLLTFAEDNAGMQYTTASYYSPNGRSIHGTGVEPDVVVELSEDSTISTTDPDPETDNQLAAAIEALEERIAAYSASDEADAAELSDESDASDSE